MLKMAIKFFQAHLVWWFILTYNTLTIYHNTIAVSDLERELLEIEARKDTPKNGSYAVFFISSYQLSVLPYTTLTVL